MPFSWGDLLGQDALVQQCKKWVALGTMPHAISVCAPEGGGKRTFARLLAASYFCKGDTPPCGVCGNCRRIEHEAHPDLIWIRESKNAAMGITEANEITTKLRMVPFMDMKRMVVIERFHTMTEQGQNKLLKTLEEPPEGTVLVLLCDSVSQLLPTVLSRCTLLRLQPLETSHIIRILRREGVDAEAAEAAATLSGGWLGQARQAAGDETYLDMLRTAEGVLTAFPEKDGFLSAFRLLNPYRKGRLEDCLSMMSGRLEYAAVGNNPLPDWDNPRILAGWQAVENARQGLRKNVHAGMTLDTLVLELTKLFKA